MSTITSLVKLPVRLTFGTMTFVARTGFSVANALLREVSGGPPAEASGAAVAEAAPVEWAPAESDNGAEAPAPFPRAEDAASGPATVETEGEYDLPVADVEATALRPDVEDAAPDADATSAPPPFDEPVSEEPVVVAEVAEPGAEDGAGAEVSVQEPLSGYHMMKAADVVDWLQTATAAEVAVTELYERAHRGRKSVFAAAERRLKEIANSPRGR